MGQLFKRRIFLRKENYLLIFFFFSSVLFPLLIYATSPNNLELILLNEIEEKNPGETVLIKFFLHNPKPQPQEVILKYFWPENWTFLGKEEEITLNPWERKLFLAPFYIPKKTKAGENVVKIEVLIKGNQNQKLEKDIRIKVKSRIDLELKAASLSLVAKAGEEIIFPFSIINRSNQPVRISLKPETNFSWPIRLDEENFFLELGQERKIEIRVKTKRSIPHKCTLHLILTAIAEGSDSFLKLTAYSTANILPELNLVEKRKTFPLNFSFLSLLKNKEILGQANVQLTYTINQRQKFDLYLRAPAQKDFRLFGYFPDEYRMLYERVTWSIYFGDKLYSCSRLTNFGEYGRGIDLNWRSKWIEIKTSFYQPLFQEETTRYPFSLKLNFFPQKKINLILNFLETKDKENRNITLYSFESQVKNQYLQTELELALSTSQQNPQSSAVGFWLDLFSTFKKWRVKTIFLATKPNFAGFYQNLNFTSFNLSYIPFPSFELKSGYSSERTNPQGEMAPFSQLNAAFFGLNFHPGNHQSIILTANHRRTSLYNEISKHFEEKYIQIDFIKLFHHYSFSSYVNYGKANYFPNNNDQTIYGFGLSLNGNIAQKSFIAVNFRWRNQKNNYFDEYHDNKEISLNFKKILSKFELILLYKNLWHCNQKVFFLDRELLEKNLYKNISNYFESSLNLTFNPKNSLSFKLRYARGKELRLIKDSDWLALIEYRISFPFLFSEETERSQVIGKIVLAENPKKGVKGIRVKLNSLSTITDHHGQFSFSGLAAGNYFLSIDTDSLPAGLIPLTSLPLKLELESKGRKSVEILLAQASQLRGRILNLPKKNSSKIWEAQANLEASSSAELVEIKQGNLRLTCQVKEDGSFFFGPLRPGKWEIKYENRTIEINLLPGEKREISLESQPIEKTIFIVDKGEINLSPQLEFFDSLFMLPKNAYLLQLGAFSVRENASKFLEIIRPLFPEAKLAGQEIGSKFYYKVFLASSDLNEAKKLMEAVIRHGYEAFLIPPTEPKRSDVSQKTSDFSFIQVGSFSDQAKALALKKLLEKEYGETIIETITQGQKLFYRVQIKIPKDEAKNIIAKLKQNKIKYWIQN